MYVTNESTEDDESDSEEKIVIQKVITNMKRPMLEKAKENNVPKLTTDIAGPTHVVTSTPTTNKTILDVNREIEPIILLETLQTPGKLEDITVTSERQEIPHSTNKDADESIGQSTSEVSMGQSTPMDVDTRWLMTPLSSSHLQYHHQPIAHN